MRPRIRISIQESALILYAVTLALEFPTVIARFWLIDILVVIFTLIFDHHLALGSSPWEWLGLIPVLWSPLALISPHSGWWWMQTSGGREPSSRERAAYEDAIELLQANSSSELILPKRWFVLDDLVYDAAVCGDALMLSSAMLASTELPAVIAHELGHLQSLDGRISAALNRLFIWPPSLRAQARGLWQLQPQSHSPTHATAPAHVRPRWSFTRLVVMVLRGGLALRLLTPLWGHLWRAREYRADAYAASLNQGDELADFLEVHALIHDHPVPFLWLSDYSHPASELRIDRLRSLAVKGSAATA